MKKKDKNGEEIISLNDALLTFDADDMSLESLERRLELATASFICGIFGCSNFGQCGSFGCGTFTVNSSS